MRKVSSRYVDSFAAVAFIHKQTPQCPCTFSPYMEGLPWPWRHPVCNYKSQLDSCDISDNSDRSDSSDKSDSRQGQTCLLDFGTLCNSSSYYLGLGGQGIFFLKINFLYYNAQQTINCMHFHFCPNIDYLRSLDPIMEPCLSQHPKKRR